MDALCMYSTLHSKPFSQLSQGGKLHMLDAGEGLLYVRSTNVWCQWSICFHQITQSRDHNNLVPFKANDQMLALNFKSKSSGVA